MSTHKIRHVYDLVCVNFIFQCAAYHLVDIVIVVVAAVMLTLTIILYIFISYKLHGSFFSSSHFSAILRKWILHIVWPIDRPTDQTNEIHCHRHETHGYSTLQNRYISFEKKQCEEVVAIDVRDRQTNIETERERATETTYRNKPMK